MSNLNIAFTGHRPNKLGGFGVVNPIRDHYQSCLEHYLKSLPDREITGISGMALGWDQWAAEVCIKMSIPLIAAIPFVGQELKWPKPSQDKYLELLTKAQKIQIVSPGGYAAYKMQIRNKWLVDNCDVLVALWDGSVGGTKNCVDYAKGIGRPIINLYGP